MTQFSKAYDDRQQDMHLSVSGGATTAGNAANSNRFVAFTAMTLYAAQATVLVAGTSATTGAALILKVLTSTGTTTCGTFTLGSSTASTTFNLAASATPGGVALAQGDVVFVTNGTDASSVAAVAYEVGFIPASTFTL